MTPIPWSLDELLPHRAPMSLLDAPLAFDAASGVATARVAVTPQSAFYDSARGGVPNWVAIEWMAQAAGMLAGCADRAAASDAPGRPGFLLGTRRLTLDVPVFPAGRAYRVRAERTLVEGPAASFACTVTDEADGAEVASAALNAFRPPDVNAFLKEQLKK